MWSQSCVARVSLVPRLSQRVRNNLLVQELLRARGREPGYETRLWPAWHSMRKILKYVILYTNEVVKGWHLHQGLIGENEIDRKWVIQAGRMYDILEVVIECITKLGGMQSRYFPRGEMWLEINIFPFIGGSGCTTPRDVGLRRLLAVRKWATAGWCNELLTTSRQRSERWACYTWLKGEVSSCRTAVVLENRRQDEVCGCSTTYCHGIFYHGSSDYQ